MKTKTWAALLAAAFLAFGQASFSELAGTVTDELNAAVAGAQVTLRNAGTGEQRVYQTDETGSYLFTQLIPGVYQLTIEKPGFRKFVQSGIALQVGQRARIDTFLQVGAVTESVEVTASASLLDTEEASLGQAVENRKILELPLNGRNVVSLAALATGVVPGQGFGIGVPEGRAALIQASTANLIINGGMSAHNDVTVDGVPLSLCCQNQIAFIPSIDTTEEFRVRANLFDAQYGRASGGIISYASKSGTNEYHGSVYEFLRNKSLDANNFFSNRQGIPRGHFVYNQFGARLGGRIVRDKTFFFANYEGIRNRRGNFLSGNVPTPAELSGQSAVPVYDPLTTRPQAGAFLRDVFPGNRIPQSRFDPVSVNVSKLWPAPNAGGANNFISTASATDTENQMNVRVDHLITQSNRLFVRYSYNHNDGGLPDWYGNIASPGVFTQQIRNHNAVLDETLTISPTFIANFRYGLTRQSNVREPRSTGSDLTTFGWPLRYSASRQDTSFPQVSLAGYLGLSSNALFQRIAEVHAWGASFTRIRGRHSMRFGLDLRVYRANWVNNGNAAGSFSFNVNFTRGPDAQRGAGGSPAASFLLGYPASGSINIVEPFASPQLYSGLYFQDDIRVSRTLTLNVGLRWDVETPRWERYNRLSYFDPAAPQPIAQQAGIPNLSGGLRFVGVDGNPRKQQDIDRNNLGPRFGFAWTARPRLIVRGGYGVTYLPITARYVNTSNHGFASTTPFFSSVDGNTPVGVFRDPFPNGVTPPPGASQGLLTNIGQSFGSLLRQEPVAYSQQWSFDVQYELASNLLVDGAYSASKGTRLPVSQNLNAIPNAALSQGTALLQQVPNPFRPYVSTGALSGANTTRLQMLRPFPHFTGISLNETSQGSSSYHSLQLKLNKRFSRGFSVLASYTTGKLITDTVPSLVSFLDAAPGFQNPYDRRADRAVATQDIAQRLAISYVWELPVGKGRALLGDAPRIADSVLGGWQINGITTFQSGQPLVIGNQIPTTSGATRPNNNGRSARKTGPVHERLNAYFDTSVFSAPDAFGFGSTPRTLPDVRADGTRNFDLSVFKNFAVTERMQVQFRAEFFNIFNTPRFDAPIGTFGRPDFGFVNAQDNNPRDIQFALRFSF